MSECRVLLSKIDPLSSSGGIGKHNTADAYHAQTGGTVSTSDMYSITVDEEWNKGVTDYQTTPDVSSLGTREVSENCWDRETHRKALKSES